MKCSECGLPVATYDSIPFHVARDYDPANYDEAASADDDHEAVPVES